MKKSLGFRVEPKVVHLVVLEIDEAADEGRLITNTKFSPPAAYDEPEALKWYRDRILQEIGKHAPTHAGIKYPEVFGRHGMTLSDQKRLRIEGVILEALASKGLQTFGGIMKSISAAMGAESAKAYKSRDEVRGIDCSKLNDKCREALLAALPSIGT